MGSADNRPLADDPASSQIRQYADNRLGAVYTALYNFWNGRAVVAAGQQVAGPRRDAYSIVFFDSFTKNVLVSDFTSTPDQLLHLVLAEQPDNGTNFTAALGAAGAIMCQNWSTERPPIMFFLSDGECPVSDEAIQDVCRSAVQRGKPLSFHAVSFGPDSSAHYLKRMTELALEIQNNAPHDPLLPAASFISSSFTSAIDAIRLADKFQQFAEASGMARG